MAKGQTPWGRMGLRRWKFFQLRRKEREEQGLAPRPPHREASFEPASVSKKRKLSRPSKRREQHFSYARLCMVFKTTLNCLLALQVALRSTAQQNNGSTACRYTIY